MKAVLTVGLMAILVSGCVVRRKAPANADVMDLDNSPTTELPADTTPGAIEPLSPLPTATAQPAPVEAAPSVAEPRKHVIAAGDTLWSLSVKYYGDGKQWEKIVAANPGLAPTRMPLGKAITIP